VRRGNVVLDASIVNRLEQLRTASSAGLATLAQASINCRSNPDEITQSFAAGRRRTPSPPTRRGRTVVAVDDGIARTNGIEKLHVVRDARLPHDVTELALNPVRQRGASCFGKWEEIVEGDTVKPTKRLLDIPVGEDDARGRIVDPLGNPLDSKGDINTTRHGRPSKGARVVLPTAVKEPRCSRAEGDRRDDHDRTRVGELIIGIARREDGEIAVATHHQTNHRTAIVLRATSRSGTTQVDVVALAQGSRTTRARQTRSS